MTLYCLIHNHEHGSDAYLFKAEKHIDDGEAAAQLNVDFILDGVETIDVAPVVNVKAESVDCPVLD